jgi:hypothetical protein
LRTAAPRPRRRSTPPISPASPLSPMLSDQFYIFFWCVISPNNKTTSEHRTWLWWWNKKNTYTHSEMNFD